MPLGQGFLRACDGFAFSHDEWVANPEPKGTRNRPSGSQERVLTTQTPRELDANRQQFEVARKAHASGVSARERRL